MDTKTYLKQARQAEARIGALAERRRRCAELDRLRTPGRAAALDALQGEIDRLKKAIQTALSKIKVGVSKKALGGAITDGGRQVAFASGGVIRGGLARFLEAVPHYAAGTSKAHGTVFVAGEAGPEIMGHINGRTEIRKYRRR